MIETMITLTCNWCGAFEELIKRLHKGIGEKRFEKINEERGWLKVERPKNVIHFCGEDCKVAYLKDESK